MVRKSLGTIYHFSQIYNYAIIKIFCIKTILVANLITSHGNTLVLNYL